MWSWLGATIGGEESFDCREEAKAGITLSGDCKRVAIASVWS